MAVTMVSLMAVLTGVAPGMEEPARRHTKQPRPMLRLLRDHARRPAVRYQLLGLDQGRCERLDEVDREGKTEGAEQLALQRLVPREVVVG